MSTSETNKLQSFNIVRMYKKGQLMRRNFSPKSRNLLNHPLNRRFSLYYILSNVSKASLIIFEDFEKWNMAFVTVVPHLRRFFAS